MGARGYGAPVVLLLCALAFVVGCLVQQLPGLPDVSGGFRRSSGQRGGLRRRAIEVHPGQPQQAEAGAERERSAEGLRQPATFDDATAPLMRPPVPAAESGNDFHTTQPYQLLSWYPRMYLFPGFIDDERCQHVIDLAVSRLGPSGLAYRPGDNADNTQNVRTSQGTFLSAQQDPAGVLAWVEAKLAALSHVPVTHGEPFNVLRYQTGQHYDSHYDVFEPESYGPQSSQRTITVLVYLTDVEEGGETVFPLEGADGLDRLPNIDYRSCKDGFKYKPRRGDALLFHSMHPNGTFDKHALHGGCPVVKGEKIVMTKWIRDQPFGVF